MSQAKVDQYKEFKQNRKENLEKEKKAKQRTALIWKIVGCVAALALVVALGITAYNAIKNRIQARPIYDREEMIVNDVAGILQEETEAPTTEAATEAPTESAPESTAAGTEAESKAP